ncbi:Hypothetical predicted protein [Podarcis lilfordi]|uniref:Uncharacterized protein n=1 Tax=Podarcis lilfordi TaxID=74358 RepID=A0AA35PT10_9SAUR|nr:Hypothetical predicted protein [Podarcis lilfordi]
MAAAVEEQCPPRRRQSKHKRQGGHHRSLVRLTQPTRAGGSTPGQRLAEAGGNATTIAR